MRRRGEIDNRYVREGGISRWHQKSEYETRRKLHDVIIVLWECLEWSEYHNTWCCTLWELLLQILQSTTVCSLPGRQLPRGFHLSPRNQTSSYVPFCQDIALIPSTTDAFPLLNVAIIDALSSEPRKLCDFFQTFSNL